MRGALVLIVFLAALPVRADERFAEAQRAYVDRDYDTAIARYEALAANGAASVDVQYNLGNAYFRAGRLGRAMLAYERALALDPGMDDARYNLDVARELASARFGEDKLKGADRDPAWVRVATWLPSSTIGWVFLVLDVAFFALLLVVRFLPSGFLRTGLLVANVFLGVAVGAVGTVFALNAYYGANVAMGVVTADEAVMRETPDDRGREGPKLHSGHRARVVAEEKAWVRIRLANDMEGWLHREAFERI